MKPASFAVKHPVGTSMAFIAIVVLGMLALFTIPLELFPNIELPTVAIFTSYPGVGSFEMESSVTKRIEDALSTVNNVSSVSSQSSEGASLVTVNFNWSSKTETVLADVREKLNGIENDLPEGANRPILFKFSATSLPMFTFNVNGDSTDIDYRRLAEETIAPELEKLPGVAMVDVYGGRKAAVMVRVDLDALGNSGVPLLQVVQVFGQENLNYPAGSLELKDRYLVMRTIGAFDSLEDVGLVLVGYKGQVPVFLKDVAEVRMDYLPGNEVVRAGGRYGAFVSVQKMPGTNTVATAKAIKAELARLKPSLPPSVDIGIQTDQSTGIVRSIDSLRDAAWQGGLLAILVLLFFLRNWRSTGIVALAIPISIITIIGPMRLMGMTLNFISLLGITLGVGMLVDNSVVIIETIFRKRMQGLPMKEAAVAGADELGLAIVGSSLTNIVVFAPLLFVEGMVGKLFRDFTVTITLTQVVALVMALTLIPLLASRFMKLPASMRIVSRFSDEEHYELSLADADIVTGKKWIDVPMAWIRRSIQWLDEVYERFLKASLRKPRVLFIGAAVLLALSVGTVMIVGMEFIPETDEGTFSVQIETAIGSPYSYTEAKVIRAEEIMKEYLGDSIESMTSQVGSGTGMAEVSSGSNLGAISLTLVPKSERKDDIWKIVRTLDARLSGGIPGVKASLSIDSMSSLANTAAGSAAPIVLEITGKDLDSMAAYGRRFAERIRAIEGTRDVTVNYEEGKPELQLAIDRKQALSLGLMPFEIAATLRTAYTGMEVSRFQSREGEYPVYAMLDEKDRASADGLRKIFFINRAGTKIALESVVDIKEGFGPLTIERRNRTRMVKVTGYLSGTVALNRVMDAIDEAKGGMGPPPPGIRVSSSGSEKQMNDSFGSLGIVLLISLMLVYMVMAAQFESLLHPFIIMFSIPFAAIGMIGMLILTNTTFNLMGFIGAILLVGYVVNTGIVLIDYMKTLRGKGMPLMDAVVKGGRTRLKPVLMSVGTTLLGMLPLAIGLGTGSELQAPMGRAVFGGLMSSTIVTLFFIPTMYYVIERSKEKRAAARATVAAPGGEP
jgi:hydrophobic/amphiphilic exporter-1 (mainly G- bacteria), HAE1 family